MDKQNLMEISKKLEHQGEILENLASQIKTMSVKMEDIEMLRTKLTNLENSLERKTNILEVYIEELKDQKADKSDVDNALEKKVGRSEIEDRRKGRDLLAAKFDELSATVHDLHDEVNEIKDTQQKEINEVRHEIRGKMFTDDFVVLQRPIQNQVKALTYALYKIKSFMESKGFTEEDSRDGYSNFPEFNKLADQRQKTRRQIQRPELHSLGDNNQEMNAFPEDEEEEEDSFTTIQTGESSKASGILPPREYSSLSDLIALVQDNKISKVDPKNDLMQDISTKGEMQSDIIPKKMLKKKIKTKQKDVSPIDEQLNRRYATETKTTHYLNPLEPRPVGTKSYWMLDSGKKKTQISFATKSQPRIPRSYKETRYSGGSHTLVSPFNKVIRLYETEPPKRVTQPISLMGYDGAMYRGIKEKKRPSLETEEGSLFEDNIPSDMDIYSAEWDKILDISNIKDNLDACQSYRPPRYCGGHHTTKVRTRGMKIDILPQRTKKAIDIQGNDGCIYKGIDYGEDQQLRKSEIKSSSKLYLNEPKQPPAWRKAFIKTSVVFPTANSKK